MVDREKQDITEQAADDETTKRNRRDFLKKAAKAATVAPAVTLLMSARTKPAQAHHWGS